MSDSRTFSDFTSSAEFEPNGSLRIVTGTEALVNSLRMWIASFRGELIRRPARGGYIVQWLMKPMSEEVGIRIREAIQEGLFEDFEPRITITKVRVIPDYENQFWNIELEGYSSLLKETFSLSEKLRRISQ